MFTFVAVCTAFKGKDAKADKNGKAPVALQPISGTSPRGLNILSGTVAEQQGFVPGKTYGVMATERPTDEEYGRQFNYTKIGELSALEVMTMPLNGVKLLIAPANAEATVNTEADAPAVTA